MLENIYVVLNLATLTLVVIWIVFDTVAFFKKKDSNLTFFKVQFLFSAIMCALFIFMVILQIILDNSGFTVEREILLAIIWAFSTIVSFIKAREKEMSSHHDLGIYIIDPVDEDDEMDEDDDTAEQNVEEKESRNE